MLEQEEIEELKKNADPQQIIDKISQNNQQFEKRTQYSKEKYLKRKQAKFLNNYVGISSHSLSINRAYRMSQNTTTQKIPKPFQMSGGMPLHCFYT